jgi:DNA-directed RNA polymerase subunit RPC12/RpoP
LIDQKKRRAKNSSLLRTYGITIEQYEELLEKQEEKCFVCERHKDEFPTALAVDHDHKTGEIRGLLCAYCNHRVVGRWRESRLLKRVVEYLEKDFTGWFVPPKKKRRKKRK